MGGTTSSCLRDKVLKRLLPILQNHPEVKIDVYFIRETYGFERCTAEGVTLVPFQGGIKPNSPLNRQVTQYVYNTRIVLGDDMDMIFDSSKKPFSIFRQDGSVRYIVIPKTTSRQTLEDLILNGIR